MKTTLLILCILGCALRAKADIPPSGEAYEFDCFRSSHNEEEYRCITDFQDTGNGLSCLLMLCGQNGYYPYLVLNVSDPENKCGVQAICELAHGCNADHKYAGEVTFTLANGATLRPTLACTVTDYRSSTRYPERQEDDEPEIQIYLSLAPAEDDLLPDFAYLTTVDRLLTYDIAKITVNGTSIPLAGYRSAATLRAMFEALAEATGDAETFAYTPPAQTATTPSRQQPPARPAAPAGLPAELSVLDMVNHPFGLLDTDITYQSALQALRRHKEWDISTTDQLISIHDISGYKCAHDGIPISYVSAFFIGNRLRSFDFDFDFMKGDDEQAALADAKAAAERMVARLQEAGITLIPQENSSYELYYAKGRQGGKTIEISVRESSRSVALDCYRIYFNVSMP